MIPEKLKAGDEVRVIAPSRSMAMLGQDCIELATKKIRRIRTKSYFWKTRNGNRSRLWCNIN